MGPIAQACWRGTKLAATLPSMAPDSPSDFIFQPANVPRRTLADILFVVFLRMVALGCFWFGLQYWAMLVGYSLNGQARFDILSLPWKVAATSLALLFPIAALGLWLAVSWGVVLWAISAAAQIAMYTLWPEIFGYNRLVPLMHGLILSLYVVFRLALWVEARRKEERVRLDLP